MDETTWTIKRPNERISRVVAVLLLLAAPVGIALLAIGLFPADLPDNGNPSFIDTIFDNKGVIWAARLLLVSAAAVLAFGGVFIVVSTGIRMKNGEWLRRAGPFEVSETVASDIDTQIESWRQVALVERAEVQELLRRLSDADDMLRQLEETVKATTADGSAHDT